MADSVSFKRLILRAVLRQVSPMVIRLISVSDQLPLPEFRDIFRTILGWHGDLGYILRIHGQEFNSFRRKQRSKALHKFKLHPQEKFLYICDTLHLWEWEVRVIDIQNAAEGNDLSLCVGGRGAAPPEFCGGPTGYRLMIKRQREGAAMSDPVVPEYSNAHPVMPPPGSSSSTARLGILRLKSAEKWGAESRNCMTGACPGLGHQHRQIVHPVLLADAPRIDHVRAVVLAVSDNEVCVIHHRLQPVSTVAGRRPAACAGNRAPLITGLDAPGVDFSGLYTQASGGTAGNYVVFPKCTGDSFTLLAVHGGPSDSQYRAPVNGIQIIAHDRGGRVSNPAVGIPALKTASQRSLPSHSDQGSYLLRGWHSQYEISAVLARRLL